MCATINRGLLIDRFIWHETPTPTPPDGTATFAVTNNYVTGTLEVFIDGLRQIDTTDYTENPGGANFAMGAAPDPLEILEVAYIKQ